MSQQYEDQIRLIKRKQRLSLTFFSMIVLAAGVVIGYGVAAITAGSNAPAVPARDIVQINERMMHFFERKLDLTEDQSDEIRKIIRENFEKMDKLREEARPKIAALMNQMHADATAVLDEKQQEIWQSEMDKLSRMFNDSMRGGGPGDSPRNGRSRGRDGEGPRRRGGQSFGRRWDPNDPNRPRPFYSWRWDPNDANGPSFGWKWDPNDANMPAFGGWQWDPNTENWRWDPNDVNGPPEFPRDFRMRDNSRRGDFGSQGFRPNDFRGEDFADDPNRPTMPIPSGDH